MHLLYGFLWTILSYEYRAIIVCIMSSPSWCKGYAAGTWECGFVAMQWFPWDVEPGLGGGFMYTASKWYQHGIAPTGLHSETWQPDMDVQLWAIGQMCPVTAGAVPPRSQPLCPGTDSPSLPLITHMPVGHLSAAPTDLLTIGFQQLSGFVLASLKASTAAGELTLISEAVVSCLVLMLHATVWRETKRFLQSRQCFHVGVYQIHWS